MRACVTIESIAAGGDGVGRLDDGLALFVPQTAPGDAVEVDVVCRKARYARGRVVCLLSSGPDRVEPRCPHYRVDDCGGCQLQHLSIDAQRNIKRRILGDALRRIGKRAVADPEIIPSKLQWRYRSKVTLAARGPNIGLRPRDRPNAAFRLIDCMLVHERVMALWELLRSRRRLLPDKLESLVLREDRTGGIHVVAVGGAVGWDAAPLAQHVGDPSISYWWKPARGAARVVSGPRAGFPAIAFEQVNAAVADVLRGAAVESLGPVEGRVVWDLYGGVGDTAELLAARGAQAWSVDVDRSAVEWGRARGGAVHRIAARAEECLARLPAPDAVVVNPPRAGLARRLAAWLDRWGAESNGARLAYVSCDPATLARDLARMPSLGLRELTAYDLFPQTSHVEALALLEAA